MKPLPNEETVLTSNCEKVILTNQRIQLSDQVRGRSCTISIFLENISSVEVHFKYNIIYLILGFISILGGIIMGLTVEQGIMLVGLFVGAIFFAFWWFSGKHLITIASDGGSSLNFEVNQMSDEVITNFLFKVQLAKHKRLEQLYKQ